MVQQLEDDVDKANSLMALYDIRMKVKEQDHTSLLKLREKIAALQARQQAEKKEASANQQHSRYTYPKAPA
jgi:Tfp pilus assembly protein PilO